MSSPPIDTGPPPRGWYPDPAGTARERYWDGARWTQVVRVPEALQQRSRPAGPGRTGVADPALDLPLAGWWRRFGSGVVDLIVGWALTYLVLLLAAPAFLRRWYHEAMVVVQAVETCVASMGHTCQVTTTAYQQDSSTILVVAGAVIAVYGIVFLGTWGATPGQRLCGIRVVRAPLPLSMLGAQATTEFKVEPPGWLRAVSKGLSWALFSTGGSLFIIVQLVNALMPLWHRRKQSLTDLFANTLLIRTTPKATHART